MYKFRRKIETFCITFCITKKFPLGDTDDDELVKIEGKKQDLQNPKSRCEDQLFALDVVYYTFLDDKSRKWVTKYKVVFLFC